MVEALAARADSQLRRRLCGGDGGSCGSVRGAGPERRPRGRRRRWAMTDSGSGPVDVFLELDLNGGREEDDSDGQ